jgi:DNA polymerase III subunit delta
MSKEVQEILLDLKRKIVKPIYFLQGEEPFYIDQISDFIENNIVDESLREFDQTILYGKDTDMGTIIGSAKRYPMMSEYQVVIVKEAQNLKEFSAKSSGDDEKPDGKQKNLLAAYIDQPQPSTVLVFCHKYKSIDKRSSIYKALQKKAIVFESKKLYDNQVPQWVTTFLDTKKYKINPRATQLIADSLGNDLSKIANELEKLMINVPAGTEISFEHIQQNIGISKDYNVFELHDALGKKDVLKANRIVNYFSQNTKDHPFVMTVASLYGYFNKILLAHFAPDKSRAGLASALGINPFFVQDYERAMAQYNTAKLKSIFALLREYDGKSKGIENVSNDDGELLKEMVFKILH